MITILRLIHNLYIKQDPVISIKEENHQANKNQKRGITDVYHQSPGLSNAYFKMMTAKVIDGCKLTIKVNAKQISTVIFACDQENLEGLEWSLQNVLNINKITKILDFKVNIQKKAMAWNPQVLQLNIEGINIHVNKFTYLCQTITEDE